MCFDHDECEDGEEKMPCVVGHCGERQYYEAVQTIPCERDIVCQVNR